MILFIILIFNTFVFKYYYEKDNIVHKVSKTILTSVTARNTDFWTNIHISSAYLGLVLISVHIGMHWNSIMCAFRKMFKINIKVTGQDFLMTRQKKMRVNNRFCRRKV